VRKTKKHKPKGYWQQRENRVKFFKELAEEAGFDPSDAASWSNVTQAQVIARKVERSFHFYPYRFFVAREVLRCYGTLTGLSSAHWKERSQN